MLVFGFADIIYRHTGFAFFDIGFFIRLAGVIVCFLIFEFFQRRS